MQAGYNQAVAIYNNQLETFWREFSARMDARNYSVK